MRFIAYCNLAATFSRLSRLIAIVHNSDEGEDDDEEPKKQREEEEEAAAASGAGEDDGDDLSEAELERRRRLEYEEEDAPLVEEKVSYAQVRLPKIPMASQTEKVRHILLVASSGNVSDLPFYRSAASCKG